jgi:hypothetical protein
MTVNASRDLRLLALYFIIVLVSCSPVLGVEYFTNHDGIPHLYNAYLIGEIIKGNQFYTDTLALNSIAVPNSSGHWIMAVLLQLLSPFVVTKIMVVLTFGGVVAGVGWLRYRTAGRDGMEISLLIGAALAFNWMWLLGFYNFIIGFVFLLLAVGFMSGWRHRITIQRALIFTLIFLGAYLSHVVSFAVTAGSVILLILLSRDAQRVRNLFYIGLALVPVVPLALIFRSISSNGSGFYPVWRSLEDGWSIVNVVNQLRSADPLVLISRTAFPFSDAVSTGFAVFAPSVWVPVAFMLLAAATIRERGLDWFLKKETLPFAVLFVGLVVTAALAPDDFGLQHGGILRERLMLCGLATFVPLFRVDRSLWLKHTAQALLIFVVLFQTAAVWEYALSAEATTKEFLTSSQALEEGDSIASIIFIDDGLRFHSIPESNMNTLNGIHRQIMIWDNYELGHYLFPVVKKDASDRAFILDLCGSHAYTSDPRENFEEVLAKLNKTLSQGNTKLNKIVMWGRNETVESVIYQWFDPQPIFSNGRVRVLRHRSSSDFRF